MKTKKFISAIMATAMVASTMTAFSAFADTDETGNDEFSAVNVTIGEVTPSKDIFFKIDTGYDNDWYKFSLDTPSKLNLTVILSNVNHVYNADLMYYEIIDYSNNDTVVYKHDNLTNGTRKDVIYLSSGDYYIHFADDERRQSCEYKILLESTPTEESFDSKSNNNIGKASPVEFDTEYTGQVSANDDADYYTFNLAEEGMVTFNFDGDLENVDWKIYDSDEDVVQKGTFSKADTDDAISAMKSYVMTTGTFTLGITKHDTACGNYTLKLDYLKDYNNRAVSGVFACADINKDGFIDASDASVILSYYAYLSTGGKESDMNVWYETEFAEK
ncbi:MAG: hypothetical protein NC205_01930 [Prevotella sp.]|nr:hypothetical protein [Alistipes senegalensis]MCM1357326.1 hypothetical protein [Prevotella sp.]MCM1472769.1 hypothetical protein [Muribaculaceae bacterium]